MSWERWAARMARSVERRVDEVRGRIHARGARQVVPYRGFGTQREVYATGRVLANSPPGPVAGTETWWRNAATMLRHLESDEIPGARVRLELGGVTHEAVSDEEGFYRAWLRPDQPLPTDRLWHELHAEVIDPLHPEAAPVRAAGPILIPPPSAQFGVISDIDDTVIRTDATRLLSMLKRTLLENARTRLPFEGVAEFYSGLHRGPHGAANPVFYVSSSPWNLYAVLTDFLEHQNIPLGPLILRDWGITDSGVLPRGHGEHKLGAIRQIMDCYAHLPFILIGDSGQEDPEIYRDVVHEYRGRVAAVYIRNVSIDPARARAIGELGEEVRGAGSELLLSDDTLAAARHAAERGWVDDATIRRVAERISSS
jgi:phosphatidate phosphatase APP1